MTRASIVSTVAALLALASPALALDNDDLDTLSRHGGASFEAFSQFGNVGEKLEHIGAGKFVGMGTGSQKRALARQVDSAMQPWRNASAAAKGSLSYKLVPSAMLATDIATSFIAPTMEGDIRGAMSGAVNIAVAPTVVGSFTAIGTGTGAMLGSFVPVVGNALGGMVGGAIGTVVGGYVSAYAYDKYVKELVARAVEGGIAAVFDTSPLQQAMQARQAFLHQNASPEVKAEWDRMNAISRSFGGGEGQVLDWERLPYIVTPKPATPAPSAAASAPEQQAALTTGNVLAGLRQFRIGDHGWEMGGHVWTISGGVATHRIERPGRVHQVEESRGTVSVNRIEGIRTRTYTDNDENCGYVMQEAEPFIFVFSAETVKAKIKAGPVRVLSTWGRCKPGFAATTEGRSWTAPWSKIE